MPPPVVIPAPQLCHALDQLIEWATSVSDVICCIDPNLEISCGESDQPSTLIATSTPVPTTPLIVNCPPAITEPPSDPTTAGDLCQTMQLIIAWAEDLKDIVCLLPKEQKIHVPEKVMAKAKARKAALAKKRLTWKPSPKPTQPLKRGRPSRTAAKSTRKRPGG